MPPPTSILTILCLFGILQGLLLATAVATHTAGLRRANRILATVLLGAALVLGLILLSHTDLGSRAAEASKAVEALEFSLWFFAGPLLLFYISVVTSVDRWPAPTFLLHALPGLAWLGYIVLATTTDNQPNFPPVAPMILYQAGYTVLSIFRWRSWKRDPTSDPVDIGIHAFAVPAMLTIVLVQHAAQLLRWTFRTEAALENIVPLAGSGSFVVLALFGLRKAFAGAGMPKRRYAGSSLSSEKSKQLSQDVIQLLTVERPFLQPDLTLDEVANALGTSKTHLSQAINDNLDQTFLDLLARSRVEESVRLLSDPNLDHIKIEAIGQRSGFKSRSAFYEAFKRQKATTPAAFRKSAR